MCFLGDGRAEMEERNAEVGRTWEEGGCGCLRLWLGIVGCGCVQTGEDGVDKSAIRASKLL